VLGDAETVLIFEVAGGDALLQIEPSPGQATFDDRVGQQRIDELGRLAGVIGDRLQGGNREDAPDAIPVGIDGRIADGQS